MKKESKRIFHKIRDLCMNDTFSETLHKNVPSEKKKKKSMRTETDKWKSDNGIWD